ncbi:hypothetical protein P3T76_002303 [Phytophthora citrophthora]|uniref:MULE transposase domain-containing protein n=1 Tax=Phytophthora citrophthora TaxID=4793 RepID=A0AAD9GY71_9STRA|nr:hypothetical protein P3T76_002303 [Phytophthora citrophthora]
MRYKLLRCACKHCTDAVPYDSCAWRLKVLFCQEIDSVDVHDLASHHSRARAPRKTGIIPRQRNFITELARENLMPLRILRALGRKFDLQAAALPSLRTMQNIVHHFRRMRLGGNGKHKLIVEAVRAPAFSGREGDHDAFTFINEYDSSGIPAVGNGSYAKPFLVSMTTKALLQNTARDPGTFVLHLDATFKLNSVGYPVLVWGITDVSRTFHLVSLFITSQLQEAHFATALVALRRMYARVNEPEMQVKYILGDADKAQLKAFQSVFADCNFVSLMCFYHVVAKLREITRVMSSSIDFILGDADPALVHVRAMLPMWTFVPALNRVREDIATSAQFGVHYARMEVSMEG